MCSSGRRTLGEEEDKDRRTGYEIMTQIRMKEETGTVEINGKRVHLRGFQVIGCVRFTNRLALRGNVKEGREGKDLV